MEGPATNCGAGARQADVAATNQGPCVKDTYKNLVTGDTTTTERCPDGTVKIQGWNRSLTWQETYLGDGSSFGIDACGVQWSYNAKTRLYADNRGVERFGYVPSRINQTERTRCSVVPGDDRNTPVPGRVPFP